DINRPAAPCFVDTLDLIPADVNGTIVKLTDAHVAGVLIQEGIMTGLLSGFISQDDADNTLVSLPAPLSTQVTLGSLLAGDEASCEPDHNKDGILDHDARDVGPDGHTTGWYFYFNFTAVQVPYSQ